MYKVRTVTLVFALFGLGGCGDGTVINVPPTSQSTEAPAGTPTLVPETASMSTGNLAHVTYHYDPHVLARAETEIALPPSFAETVFAIKFIPRSLIPGLGSSQCSFGGNESMTQCTADREIGFALALLDRPVEHYTTAIARTPGDLSAFEPVQLHGVQGFTTRRTTANATTSYTFLPTRGRTMLLIDRTNTAVDAGTEALAQVRDSITFQPGT